MAKQQLNYAQVRPIASGSTTCLTGTATDAVALGAPGIFLCTVHYPTNEASTPYAGYAIISVSNTNRSKILASGFGSAITITMSNLNMRITQSSGITLVVPWSVMRLM